MPSEFAIQALLALEDTCPLLHRSRAARNVARYLPATLLLSAGLIGVLGFADDIVVRWLDGEDAWSMYDVVEGLVKLSYDNYPKG